MDKCEIVNELNSIIGDYLKNQGLDLVDLIYRYEGKNIVLRILADRIGGGISLDECVRLNNEISCLLDEKDILQSRYTLEVSSPGLDRPLATKKDFLRCLNRQAVFFLREPVNNVIELKGEIKKVEEDSVYVDTGSGVLMVPLSAINKAKQII